MPSFLPKFIAKRLGIEKSASKKYSQDAAADEDGLPIDALVLVGGGLCAVTHQDAVSSLIAELLGGVKVFVDCVGATELTSAIEDALSVEAAHLLASPTSFDDTRSVATLRGGGSPTSPSSPSSVSSSGSSRRLVVLYFPLLTQGHCGAVLEALVVLPNILMRPLGCVVFDGSSSAMENAPDIHTCRERWTHAVTGSGGRAVLSVPMGCTVFDTYELGRVAALLLDTNTSSITIADTSALPSDRPPLPGGDADEELGDDARRTLNERSASFFRIKMCRTSALDALRVIAWNVQETPDSDRFRVLVTSSERFRVTLGDSPNAMQVLSNMGFRSQGILQGSRGNGVRIAGVPQDAWGEARGDSLVTADPTKLILPLDVALGAGREVRRLVRNLDAELARRRAPPPTDGGDTTKPRKK